MKTSKDLKDKREMREFHEKNIIDTLETDSKTKKGEFLHRAMSILEILPVCECQRVYDYLSELYLS